jgi:hypothetical protein
MNYLGPAPEVSYYNVAQMREFDRKEFLLRYETTTKNEVFDKRRVLQRYCQSDVTVLREAFRTFRRHFLQIGNVEVIFGSMTISSACNKAFRKKFLEPERTGIFRSEFTRTTGSRVRRR